MAGRRRAKTKTKKSGGRRVKAPAKILWTLKYKKIKIN